MLISVSFSHQSLIPTKDYHHCSRGRSERRLLRMVLGKDFLVIDTWFKASEVPKRTKTMQNGIPNATLQNQTGFSCLLL